MTTVILARLLTPDDFGLFGLTIVIINILSMIYPLGLPGALVYRKGEMKEAWDTGFILIIISGVIFWGITYTTTPLAKFFFNNETLELVMKVLSLTILISAVSGIPSIMLEKELDFRRRRFAESMGSFLQAGTSISLALLGYGVWSLVYGQLIGTIIKGLLVWKFTAWLPRFKFHKEIALELFQYGIHILGLTITGVMFNRIDNLGIGKILGVAAVGYYTLASNLANLPADEISILISGVMFPSYSKVDDHQLLKKMFLATIKYISLIVIPMLLGMFAISYHLFYFLYGQKWLPAVPVFQILCFAGLARALYACGTPLFMATGNVKLVTGFNLIGLFIIIGFIYPAGKFFGIRGIGGLILISRITLLILYFKKISTILNDVTFKEYFEATKYPFIASIISISIGVYLFKFIYPQPNIFLLIVSIIITGLLYGGVLVIIDRSSLIKLKELILITRG